MNAITATLGSRRTKYCCLCYTVLAAYGNDLKAYSANRIRADYQVQFNGTDEFRIIGDYYDMLPACHESLSAS